MRFLGLIQIVAGFPTQHKVTGFGPEIETFKYSAADLVHVQELQDFEKISVEKYSKSVLEKLVPDVEFSISNMYQTYDQIIHVYYQQVIKDLPVTNAVGGLHINVKTGKIAALYHSVQAQQKRLERRQLLFFEYTAQQDVETVVSSPSDESGLLTKIQALSIFATYLQLEIESINFNDQDKDSIILNDYPKIPVFMKWIQTENGIRLVYDFTLDLDTNWYNAQVDAQTGHVLGLVDWVSHATYNVYPIGTNDPLDGERVKQIDPEHDIASPIGWTSFKTKKGTQVQSDTQGNNVYAQANPKGRNDWKRNHRPNETSENEYDYPLDLTKMPKKYLDAAIVNLFYWNNMMHDLFYVYGFNEEAGNFQDNNFGRGGKGADNVIANAQDGSGTNNANFATPPDGNQGRMRMYIWTQSKPHRDGDLESGIVIHEYAHGISTRLTGGPANSNCLGWGEAGGMGEGWGDFFATILRMSSNNTRNDDFGMGDYSNGGKGIRKYSYSTSKKVNPSTYTFIRKPGYWGVHAKGEVWAEILYEFFWDLVDLHGWEDDWQKVPLKTKKTDDDVVIIESAAYPKAGNKVALRLVVDGLKLQPCSPSFVDARNAILLADQIGNESANECVIWKAFARRGLGYMATKGGHEDYSVPEACEDETSNKMADPAKVDEKQDDAVSWCSKFLDTLFSSFP